MTLHSSGEGVMVEIESVPVGIEGATVELSEMYAGVEGANVQIFGGAKKIHSPVNSLTVTGTYANKVSDVGYGVTEDGKVVIYARNNYTTAYENIVYALGTVPDGVTLPRQSGYSSGADVGYFYFCVLEGIATNVDLTLGFDNQDKSNDYVGCTITITEATQGKEIEFSTVELDGSFTVGQRFNSPQVFSSYCVAYCEGGGIVLVCTNQETSKISIDLSSYEPKLNNLVLKYENSFSGASQGGNTSLYGIILEEFGGGTVVMSTTETSSGYLVSYYPTFTLEG
jgi:hypothetical protein